MLNKNYKIYGLVSSEFPEVIRYIGLTCTSLNRRLWSHFRDAKKYINHRTNWINRVLSRGYKINIILIENNILTIQEAKNKEVEYIKIFKSFGSNLVNGTKGGDFAAELSIETRQKLRDLRSKKVDQYDMFGKFIKTFPSILEASKNLKVSTGLIDASLRGDCLTKNSIFTYHNIPPKSINSFTTKKERKYKPVTLIDINSNNELNFKYPTEVALYLNIGKTTVRRRLVDGKLINNKYKVKFYI